MILSCPSCATKFNINPALLGDGGRKVRCAKCQNQWHATAPLITLSAEVREAAAPEIVKPRAADIVQSFSAEATASRLTARRNGLIAGVLAALLVAVPVFAWKFSALKSADAASQHAVAGKAENKKTIALDGTPSTRLTQEDGRTVLKIDGALINNDSKPQPVPKLVAQGLNAKGGIVKEWNISLNADSLEPGQRLTFTLTAPFAEQGVVDIAFRFM